MSLSQLLQNLNPDQRRAVDATEGPVVVVAGAGSGKTRVLTARIASLIERELATPREILAVTFTNKAAEEIRERIGHLVGADKSQAIRMGSFHSISLGMLRRHAKAAGLRDDRFTVLDPAEQRALLESILRDRGILPQDARSGQPHVLATFTRIATRIDNWKEEGWSPHEVPNHVALDTDELAQTLLAYQDLQELMARRNVCDFADLLLHMLRIFRNEDAVRQYWANRFRYVLVDEFQDTNPLQYAWLEALCRERQNLCVVGDPDQSIYEWRNARPAIFENFSHDWANTQVITIGQNYRSTQPILDVANAVVSRNPRLAGKVLKSDVAGAPVEALHFASHDAENAFIAQEIQTLLENGHLAEEIAILTRGVAQFTAIEARLKAHNIPVEVSGGIAFHQREEVKDALAFLRLAIDPCDVLAYQRIADRPARGVSGYGVQAVLDHLRKPAHSRHTVVEAMEHVAEREGRNLGRQRQALVDDAHMLAEIQGFAVEHFHEPAVLLEKILTRIGYVSWRIAIGDQQANEREESLQALLESGQDYNDAALWIQTMAIESSKPVAGGGRVRLSTIHAAKGLEFDVVFCPCTEEGLLPNARSLEASWGLAEERRIAHVAWTRAKRRLIISWTTLRAFQPVAPSRFLVEAGLMEEDVWKEQKSPKSQQKVQRTVLRRIVH